MHCGLANNNSPSFLPFPYTPRAALQATLEVQLTPQCPLIPLQVYLVLHHNRHSIQWAQRLPLLVSLRRGLRSRNNRFRMRFEESDRVLAGWLSIATDQGEEGLDDVDRRQFC